MYKLQSPRTGNAAVRYAPVHVDCSFAVGGWMWVDVGVDG